MSTRIRFEDAGRGGFSLVELIVAVTILAIGLLGMGTTMVLSVQSVTTADLTTERAAARQAAVERVRSTPYADLAVGSDSVGIFAVEWSLLARTASSTRMRVVTTGPGRRSLGGVRNALTLRPVADTFDFRVLRP